MFLRAALSRTLRGLSASAEESGVEAAKLYALVRGAGGGPPRIGWSSISSRSLASALQRQSLHHRSTHSLPCAARRSRHTSRALARRRPSARARGPALLRAAPAGGGSRARALAASRAPQRSSADGAAQVRGTRAEVNCEKFAGRAARPPIEHANMERFNMAAFERQRAAGAARKPRCMSDASPQPPCGLGRPASAATALEQEPAVLAMASGGEGRTNVIELSADVLALIIAKLPFSRK